MAEETPTTPTPRKRAASTRKTPAAGTTPKRATRSKTPAENTTMTTETLTPATPTTTPGTTNHKTEAKSRFNAAVKEAKAGAMALKAEASERAGAYRGQAEKRGKGWASDAKAYGEDARVKGKDLATQGKGKVVEGLNMLGQTIDENAYYVDEKLGAKYGDYARTASRSLRDYGSRLDEKTVDELGEDARQFVRKSPATVVGMAAVFGFMLSRLFSRR
ncbi:hypothetical protein [Qipengyuania sp.]|uniref:hypothetical protein n=1 Tax=Qipengyuania sp. TaxID=2004515 RepID=UPI0035C79BBC